MSVSEVFGHARARRRVRVRSQDSAHVRIQSPKKSCVRVRVCFGHGLGHEFMSEVVSVSVHLWSDYFLKICGPDPRISSDLGIFVFVTLSLTFTRDLHSWTTTSCWTLLFLFRWLRSMNVHSETEVLYERKFVGADANGVSTDGVSELSHRTINSWLNESPSQIRFVGQWEAEVQTLAVDWSRFGLFKPFDTDKNQFGTMSVKLRYLWLHAIMHKLTHACYMILKS